MAHRCARFVPAQAAAALQIEPWTAVFYPRSGSATFAAHTHGWGRIVENPGSCASGNQTRKQRHMKLSASSLGAPDVDADQLLRWLTESGVNGLELRVGDGQIAGTDMEPARRRQLRDKIDAAGVELTGLASYVHIAQAGQDAQIESELVAALELASDLGAPFVRVFPGAPAEDRGYMAPPGLLEARATVNERAARRLSRVAGTAARLGVLPVIETHDSHPTGRDIAAIAALVDGPVGVVWDLMHPWRVGESLMETWAALGPWLSQGLGSVQIKDAALPEDRTPVLIGDGTLPCEAFRDLLVRRGYSGTVTLELEAAWYPAAPPLPEALASARLWSDRETSKVVKR